MNFEFGHWLMGFIDAEGCFRVSQHTNKNFYCIFALKVRDDDNKIIELIKVETSIGTIRRERPNKGNQKPNIKWAIETKQDCIALCGIIDKFGLRSKKQQDYEIWKNAVKYWNVKFINTNGNRHIDMLKMKIDLQCVKKYNSLRPKVILNNDDGFKFWLSGFTDGEGCFTIEKTNYENCYVCVFGISQRNDDGGLLSQIQECIKCGNVTTRTLDRWENPQGLLRIRKKEFCYKFMTLLNNNLKTKKARDFEIWKEAVQILNSNLIVKNQISTELKTLKHQLSEIKKYTSVTHS